LERGIQTGSRKDKSNTQITTLRKADGLLTKDAQETLRLMLEYFTPEDNDLEDNEQHKQVRDIRARLLTHQTIVTSQEKNSEK